jgi:hypothetical protein
MNRINQPWNYSFFWVLINSVRQLPFTYFKPIIYNNIFSMLYLPHRQALKTRTTNNNPFSKLYKEMVAECA